MNFASDFPTIISNLICLLCAYNIVQSSIFVKRILRYVSIILLFSKSRRKNMFDMYSLLINIYFIIMDGYVDSINGQLNEIVTATA